MRSNAQKTGNWDWLADPDAALKLYSTERKAFYDWQMAAKEWSEATRHSKSGEVEGITQEQSDTMEVLKKRLDEAAETYELARQQLHEAWSA